MQHFVIGNHTGAALPFLQDRTPYTQSLMTSNSVSQARVAPLLGQYERQVRMGPSRSISVRSDIRLLSLMRHERLEWVTKLS